MINVIIPAYNAEKFIVDAIKSVEAQTLKPDLIFVINDGSTDETEKAVKEYVSSIPLTYIAKENGGPNSARNKGVALSRAEFVAFLDADDTWAPAKLEEQMKIYKETQFPDLGLVYSGYDALRADGSKDIGSYIVPLDTKIRGNAFARLLSGNKILGSASGVLIKRSVFETVGTFDEALHFGEDWDMWLRISEQYAIDFTDKTLVHVRRHATNQTNKLDRVFLGEIDFFNKWTDKIEGKYPIPARWADQIAFHIIIKFRHPAFIKKAMEKLSPSAKKLIFKSTFGSPYMYVFFYCLKKAFSPNDWSHLIKKLKSYA